MGLQLRRLGPYAVVLAAAAFLFWKTLHFDYTPQGDRPGPDVWPRTILALMIATCAIRIISILVLRSPVRDEGVLEEVIAETAPAGETPEAPAKTYPLLLATGIAITVAYVYLLGILGFFIATLLLIASLIRTGRYRRWTVIVPTALLGSLGFMFVFMKIVYLSLPIGVAPFASVSLALMQWMGIR